MRKALLPLFIFMASSLLMACGEKTDAASGSLYLKKIGSFSSPLYIAQAPGNKKVYVVEQGGRIRVRTSSGWKTFLDIRGRVTAGGEQGLLGLAFHPFWRQNKRFYVYYTNKKEDQVLWEGRSDRWGRSAKLLRPVLYMNDFASNHNGGQLQFYKGDLYIGTGDGGGAGDPRRTALNPNSLLGKILRIHPTPGKRAAYSIPADNPYVGGGGKKQVFSLGLRNPWRFSFDEGRLWIGDVGQSAWEEIDAPLVQEARGASFGWSAYEGPDPYTDNPDQSSPGAIFPVFSYPHEGRCSITGGYVVRSIPSLDGQYLFADLCDGKLRSFSLSSGQSSVLGLRISSPSSFGRGNGGQIWVASIEGPVYRLLGP